MEYVIKGDTPEYKNCLVCVEGKNIKVAEDNLYRMLNNPSENDKKLIKNHSNLRIEEVTDEECWWNYNCD